MTHGKRSARYTAAASSLFLVSLGCFLSLNQEPIEAIAIAQSLKRDLWLTCRLPSPFSFCYLFIEEVGIILILVRGVVFNLLSGFANKIV